MVVNAEQLSQQWASSIDALPIRAGASRRHRTPGYPYKKRALDLVLCTLALPVALPILAVCALAVRLTSRGPVFFIQERTGWRGRRFRMVKFRTMVVGAADMKAELADRNEMRGPDFKIQNDPRVTAVGRFVKQALIENEGIPEQRISVIYNGIDPAQFRSAAGEDKADVDKIRRETREELGIKPDTPVVLHVARMHPVKDHITGLAAMVNVVREIPDAQLLLAGDGVERRRLEAKANEFGIKDNVKFLGVREDVPRLMAATDVFMLCSVSEGISVTLLEAMAAGKPIAATDVGGNSEVVGHGSAGFLSKRGNSAELGKNLLSLLRNPSLRTKAGRAGRDRLLKQFSQEQMHTAYTKLYDEMLKRVM